MDVRIHQARKRAKRLLGMLRLLWEPVPGYDRENVALRHAVRHHSRLSDRDVMIASHDRLMDDTEADRRRNAAVKGHLTRARTRIAAEQNLKDALPGYALEMSARTSNRRLKGKDTRALRGGLERRLAQAFRATRRAKKRRDVEDLHAWRKRVRDHRCQTRLLERAAP